jgi:hypothetical protein
MNHDGVAYVSAIPLGLKLKAKVRRPALAEADH